MITPELLQKYLEDRCSTGEKVVVEEWYSLFGQGAVMFKDEKGIEALHWLNKSKLQFDRCLKSATD